MSRAPRKLQLSESEVKVAEDAFQKFGNSSLKTEKLFNLFKEWQSLKTRSIKRFVLSLSSLLTIGCVINLDITEIKPLGINVSDADQTVFLLSLLVIHVMTFIYYRYQRSTDINVNKAEISLIEEELSDLLELTDVIDNIINEDRAKSFSGLIHDTVDSNVLSRKLPNARTVYHALSLFKQKLKKEQRKRELGEIMETLLIYILGITGFIYLAISLYK